MLSFIIIFSSFTVFADGQSGINPTGNKVCLLQNTSVGQSRLAYNNFDDLFSYINKKGINDCVIELVADITLSSPINIPNNTHILFVSNDSDKNFDADFFGTEYINPNAPAMTISGNSKFTVTQGASVELKNLNIDATELFIVKSGATLTVSEKVSVLNATSNNIYTLGGAVNVNSGGNLIINNTNYLNGDVNYDNLVNLIDLVYIKKRITNNIFTFSIDVDRNSKFDTNDLIYIRKTILGVVLQ